MIVQLFWLGIVGAVIAIGFAFIQARKVLGYSEGNDTMKKIAGAIRVGADAYLKRQYTTVIKFFVIVFVILCALAFIPILMGQDEGLVNRFAPFAFLTGGFFT